MTEPDIVKRLRLASRSSAELGYASGELETLAADRIERLTGLLYAILYSDERGQGVQFSEAMNAAAKEIGYP